MGVLKQTSIYFYSLLRFRFLKRRGHPEIILHLTRDYLGHEGRYLFLLLYFLSYSGRRVLLVRNIWTRQQFAEVGIYGSLSFKLKSVRFSEAIPAASVDTVLI